MLNRSDRDAGALYITDSGGGVKRMTTNGGRQTADERRRTTDDGPRTADDRRRTMDDG